MTDMENGNKSFKWGDISTNPADLPAQSLFALAQRGYTHVLGNEVASQVATWRKTEDGAKASEAEVEAYAKSKRDEKLAKILDGTLGVRTAAGPRVSGIEALKRQVAIEFLKAAIKAYNGKTGKNVALPTGEKVINYMGKEMTREQLVDAYSRANEAKVSAEAERRQQEQEAGADVGEDLFAG